MRHINNLLSSLDPLDAPKTRSKTNGKRKRSPSPRPNPKVQFQLTPLRELFVDGMNEDQLWAQIDLRTKNVRDILNLVLEEDGPLESDEGEEADDESDSEEEETELEDVLATHDSEDVEWSDEDIASDEDGENEEEFGLGDDDQIETIAELRDPSDEESESISSRPKLKSYGKSAKHGRHPQLDDDFFDLAAFNAEIEAAEARSSGRGRLSGSDQDEDSDDEVIDMFAPIDEGQSLEGGLGEEPSGMCNDHTVFFQTNFDIFCQNYTITTFSCPQNDSEYLVYQSPQRKLEKFGFMKKSGSKKSRQKGRICPCQPSMTKRTVNLRKRRKILMKQKKSHNILTILLVLEARSAVRMNLMLPLLREQDEKRLIVSKTIFSRKRRIATVRTLLFREPFSSDCRG